MIKVLFTFLFYAGIVAAIGYYPTFFWAWARSEHPWRSWKIWTYLPYLAITLLLAWVGFYFVGGLIFRNNTLNYVYAIFTLLCVELSLLQFRPAGISAWANLMAMAYNNLRLLLAALHIFILMLSPILIIFLHLGVLLLGFIWSRPLLLAPGRFSDMHYKDGYYAYTVSHKTPLGNHEAHWILIAEDHLLLMKPIASIPIESTIGYTLRVTADSVKVYWTELETYTAVARRPVHP